MSTIGSANYNSHGDLIDKFQQEYSVKIEHKFTDKVSLTGFYLYNRTDEPCANYFGRPGRSEPLRRPGDYILKRRPQILAINNTWVPNDSSVMALRFGWTTFPDNPSLSIDFDPSTLGFSSNFLSQIANGRSKFPLIDFTDDLPGFRSSGPGEESRLQFDRGTNGVFSQVRRDPYVQGRR